MAQPRMTLQTLELLSAMLDDCYREWYGLELSAASGLKTGTIYPALARLEQARWVSSYWEDVDPSEVGRPKRRLYRLTGEGADAARTAVDEHLQRLAKAGSSLGGRILKPESRTA
jgi:PadR family transcriptional regulator, regulatory protein PadR